MHNDHYEVDFIPKLTQLDSIVSWVFLGANTISYNFRTEDPWFPARTSKSRFVAHARESDSDEAPYFADDPTSVLGCSKQRFIYNPDLIDSDCMNSLSRNESIFAIQK
jgi:hypothetical protein